MTSGCYLNLLGDLFLTALVEGLVGPVDGTFEFEDGARADDAVNGCCSGHRVRECLVRL